MKYPAYQKNKMNIDGVQELNAMDEHRITLVDDYSGNDMVIYKYDDVIILNKRDI